jgi:transposase
MFIREVKKQRSSNTKVFYQYSLVQASRINGKVKQRVILYLGSDKILRDKDNRQLVLTWLKSQIFKQSKLFPTNISAELVDLANTYYKKYLIKYPEDAYGKAKEEGELPSIPPDDQKALYEQVDILGVACGEVKTFGGEHLCSQVLTKLELDQFLRSLEWKPFDRDLALIGIVSRALFGASEYKTSKYLKDNSDLISCISHQPLSISHKQLYRIADKLYKHKDQIDRYLHERITTMFNLEDKLVIFDLSNTYFETRKQDSDIAQYGRSKEKRKDCKLVVFTGVINSEGFIRHSRIYEGNKPDTATMADMLKDLEGHSKKGVKKTIVIDAGIATEGNLDLITSKEYNYVCVARAKIKDYHAVLSKDKVIQLTDRGKNKIELKILKDTGEYNDTWMYVKSEAKRKKEKSMEDKLEARYIEDLEQIKKGIKTKGGTKILHKVWERLGRAKQKYPSIAKDYEVKVEEKKIEPKTKRVRKSKKEPKRYAADLIWSKKESELPNPDHGVYFIRTNYENPSEKELWNIYNTIREVEATFRCLKSDLNIRPVHHQLDHRIESHIYLTMLAYQMVNTIRYMLKQKNINYDWTNIVRIMNTHTIQTIQLPTPTKTIHLRAPAKPIEEVHKIYEATNTTNTMTTKEKYVVYH